MAKRTAAEFIDLTRRSKLIADDQLRAAVQRYKRQHQNAPPIDSEPLASFLENADLLTPWQIGMLHEGKYKGFFLGKYKLLSKLGQGGMSTVYLATHIHMQRRVAIKVLPKKRVSDSSYLARFYLEAQAAAALDHPNIVRAYDIDSQQNTHYLVMEFVDGQDLQAMVRQQDQPMDVELVAYHMSQAATGLQHAHDNGLVHRDIKPANLLIDAEDHLKLLDLGLARFQDGAEQASLTVTHEEKVLGTADYLAPEQALNSHQVDARVDIYSLGCTMYFALVGHPPFPDGTLAERIAKHQAVEPPEIRELRSDCPSSLAAICRRMMQKDPDERYATAHEVAEALQQWLRDCGSRYASGVDDRNSGSADKARRTGGNNGFPHIVTDDAKRPSSVGRRGRHRSAPEKPSADPSAPTTQPPASPDGGRAAAAPLVTETPPVSTAADSNAPLEAIPDEPTSLLQARQQRRGRSQKPPLLLWIAMGGLAILAIGLFIYTVVFA